MNPEKDVLSKIHAMPTDGAPTDFVMHEFTLSMIDMKDKVGVTGKDIAKRLLDYGVMAPTLYFPMIVPESVSYTHLRAHETREDLGWRRGG